MLKIFRNFEIINMILSLRVVLSYFHQNKSEGKVEEQLLT